MTWQDLIALTAVAVSITYVITRVLRPARGSTPGCGSCPAGRHSCEHPIPNLIPVEEIRRLDDRA